MSRQGGALDKAQGVDYLSDHVVKGLTTPGPTQYESNPNFRHVRRSSDIKLREPTKGLEKKTWRHEKVEGPDMGSYFKRTDDDDMAYKDPCLEAHLKTSNHRRTSSVKFTTFENVRFTTQYAKDHDHVPAPDRYFGNHEEANKCHRRLSRPPSASIRRRL